jgi:hypothetical protein
MQAMLGKRHAFFLHIGIMATVATFEGKLQFYGSAGTSPALGTQSIWSPTVLLSL